MAPSSKRLCLPPIAWRLIRCPYLLYEYYLLLLSSRLHVPPTYRLQNRIIMTAADTSKSITAAKMAPPEQWPKVVVSEFEPLQVLGKGGFASVVLARRKNPDPCGK